MVLSIELLVDLRPIKRVVKLFVLKKIDTRRPTKVELRDHTPTKGPDEKEGTGRDSVDG